jgi:hypothetical protein
LNFVRLFEKRDGAVLAIHRMNRVVGDDIVLQPICPGCARMLGPSPAAPAAGAAPVRTYACEQCAVWVTEAVEAAAAGNAGASRQRDLLR